MSSNMSTIEEDLAYLRRLVESDHGAVARRKFGFIYCVCGLLWGPYCFVAWAQYARILPIPPQMSRIVWLTVMLAFVGTMFWGIWKGRGQPAGNVPTRAFAAVFAGIGYSYLVMLTVLMWAAYERRNSTFIWLYAVVVFAGQGAGWYVFWTLRREKWIGLVALGWYASALLTGLNMQLPEFLLIAGFTLILLMGIPGWVMMRETATPAR
jgi:hypothetical protein